MRKRYQILTLLISIFVIIFINQAQTLGSDFSISNFYYTGLFNTQTSSTESKTLEPSFKENKTYTPTPSTNKEKNYLEPSKNPPNNLDKNNIPQFIIFGFDDNSSSEGVENILNLFNKYNNPKGNNNTYTFDNQNIKASFYNTLKFVESDINLKSSLKRAYDEGFEIGNHTYSHNKGTKLKYDEFINELKKSESMLKEILGKDFKSFGFRTPYLSFNQECLSSIKDFGFLYDCSIPEGDQPDSDGKNCYWPYTLDNGSPCNKYANRNWNEPLITEIKGLWEIPAYNHTVPADEYCSKYKIEKGLRKRMNNSSSDFNESNGKVTGLDWNILEKFKATPKEYSAILKYTLDLRLDGNKAPLTIGMHSNYYTNPEKLEALEDFIKYALSKKDVRIITANQLISWIKNPYELKK